MSTAPANCAAVRGVSTSRLAPCAFAPGITQSMPRVPGPEPAMTSCRRPVAFEASIAANTPSASIETSTAWMRGYAAAASTQPALAALMRKNAQGAGAPGARSPSQRGVRAQFVASMSGCLVVITVVEVAAP